LFKDLILDVKALPSTENLIWAGVGGGAALAVHPADEEQKVVDVQGGLPPYTASLKVDDKPTQDGRLFDIDLSAKPESTQSRA